MNIKRLLTWLLILFIANACNKNIFEEIDYASISQVSIKKIKDIEGYEIKSVDQNEKVINDSLWIQIFFNKYLKSAEKRPCKFVSLYKVSFQINNQPYELYINSNKLMYKSETYELKYDLEEYLKK